MSMWHYVKDGQKQGPVDDAQLKALLASGLPASTLVWKDGMAEWVAASTIPELAPAKDASGAPPVIPGSAAPAIPAAGTANAPITCDADDIEKNKVMGVLAYLWILVLVPILAARQSKFAMYHANQGLVLLILVLVLSATSCFASFFMGMFLPGFLALSVHCVFSVVGLLLFVLMILGIINAAKGECKPLPVIGDRVTLIK